MRTVRVLERTFTDSSWSLAYIFGVHGSTSFGNLAEKIVNSGVSDPDSIGSANMDQDWESGSGSRQAEFV